MKFTRSFALGFLSGLILAAIMSASATTVLGDFAKALSQVVLSQTGEIDGTQTRIRGWIYSADGSVAIGPTGIAARYWQFIPYGNKPISEIRNETPDWSVVLQDTSLPADFSVADYYEAMGFGPDM